MPLTVFTILRRYNVSNVKSDGPLRVVLFKNQDFYPRTIFLVKMNSQKYKISLIIDSDRGPDNMQILASEKYTYRVRIKR